MRASALSLMRLALATDALARAVSEDIRAPFAQHGARAVDRSPRIATRCLHCRTPLLFADTGQPLNGATLEHVVPRSWFGRGAARELTAGLGDPNDARNLALACGACNHAKGRGPDARGPGDARARAVVAEALTRRLERWREDPATQAARQALDTTGALPAGRAGQAAAARGRGRVVPRAR